MVSQPDAKAPPASAVWAAFATISLPVYALIVLSGVLSANRVYVLYTWHPILEVVFYITALMGIIKPQLRRSTPYHEHKSLINQHAYWQIAAALAVAGGAAVIYTNKELKGYPHLKSWHGVAGAIATIWWLFQVVAGALIWYYTTLVGTKNLKKMRYYHKVSGYLSLLAVGAAHFLALIHGYPGYELGSRQTQIAIIALMFSMFLVLANGTWKPTENYKVD